MERDITESASHSAADSETSDSPDAAAISGNPVESESADGAREADDGGKPDGAGEPDGAWEPDGAGELEAIGGHAGRPPTGDPRVDQALRRLDGLADLPVSEHPPVFERIHGQLVEVLGELRSGPDKGAYGRQTD